VSVRQSFLIRYMCLFMAILMLVSSTGFVMVEHMCQMKGRTQSMWVGKETCKMHCPATKKAAPSPQEERVTKVKKKSCCEETSYFSRLDVSSLSSTPLLVNTTTSPTLAFKAVIYLFSQTFPSESGDKQRTHPTYSPLIYTSSQYLALLCTWLI
jgi:hypothetical protein